MTLDRASQGLSNPPAALCQSQRSHCTRVRLAGVMTDQLVAMIKSWRRAELKMKTQANQVETTAGVIIRSIAQVFFLL